MSADLSSRETGGSFKTVVSDLNDIRALYLGMSLTTTAMITLLLIQATTSEPSAIFSYLVTTVCFSSIWIGYVQLKRTSNRIEKPATSAAKDT
jgi:hypothetical protein